MEYVFYKYFDGIIDRIERCLFGFTSDTFQFHDRDYCPSIVKQVTTSDPDFLDHLDLEVFFYFLCNVIGFSVTLPSFLFIHHSWMLYFLGLLILTIHLMIIIAKLILLRRVFIIRECSNQAVANQRLWTFFHSKAFSFNKNASNIIFIVYIISFVLLLFVKANPDDSKNFLKLLSLLLLFSAFSRLWGFATKSTHYQGSEALFQLTEKRFTQSIHSLEVMTYIKYSKQHLRIISNTCSICFEDYDGNNLLRVMQCPASHAFHKICIDKWLVDNSICPVCRENVLPAKKIQ